MRQVFLNKGSVVVKEVCQPLLDDHSVLVAVSYSYISSGTECASIAQTSKNILLHNTPQKIKKVLSSLTSHGIEATAALIKGRLKGNVQTLGYSCSGSVIAMGKRIESVRQGDLVACAGAGLANHADVVSVPGNLIARVGKKEHLKAASLTTIGAIALQGIRRAQLQLGEYVCVLGLGLLGQLTVQMAKSSGCTVIGVDLVPQRLTLAKQLGADAVFHASNDDVQKEIAFFTNHCGVDSTIITAASQSDAIIQQAMEITRKKGKVVIVGDVGLNLQRNPFYKKEIDLLISCSYGPGRYDPTYENYGQDYPYAYVRWTEQRNMQAFISLIEHNKLDLDEILAEEVSIEDIEQTYECIAAKKLLGAVVRYDTIQKQPKQINKSNFIAPRTDCIRVGFVGAGGFAKVKLMPIIAKMRNVRINAIVDADVANSLSTANLYGAAQALVDDTELFSNDMVDVVVIASPHIFHCDQALNALHNRKAVFMEKPMITNYEQLEQLRTFLYQYPTAPLCVDYNRSFAPFTQKIKKVIQQRTTPLVIHYRMNAGLIPKDHWIQTEVGAGRIIGEACHIIDLFCYLTDSHPSALSVEVLGTSNEHLLPTDNVSIQISFEDGSICSLLYTSLGHADLGKERMELFFDGKSIVMDDYINLIGYGLPQSFTIKKQSVDKGHEALLGMFFDQVQKKDFMHPIPLERLTMVAELTLIINQLACQGGGNKEL